LFLAALLIKADISGDFTHDQAVFGVILSIIFAGPCAILAQFLKRVFESCCKKVKAGHNAKCGEVQVGGEVDGKQPASYVPENKKGGIGKFVGAGNENYQGESKSFAKVVGADPAEQEGGSGPREARSLSKSADVDLESVYSEVSSSESFSLNKFSLKQVGNALGIKKSPARFPLDGAGSSTQGSITRSL